LVFQFREFVPSCFRGYLFFPSVPSGFSISLVALDTELFLSIESQGELIGAAHKVMTGNTGNAALRSGINGFFSYRMGELGVSFMTGRAHLEFLVAEKKLEI